MPKTTSKPARVVPTLSSAAEIKQAREVDAPGPSGLVYTLRPINLERHALAGGLPARLRQIAMEGSKAIDKLLGGDEVADDEDEDLVSPAAQAEADETKAEVLAYLDNIVKTLLVSVPWDEVEIEDIPPVDYRWAVKVAMGEADEDGEGRRLWGREPLSRFEFFRHFHGCSEDCESCSGVREFFSAALVGSGSV